MRKISVKIGVTALSLLVGIGLLTGTAEAQKVKEPKTTDILVDCSKQSIQDAVDKAVDGDTIVVSGTCNEENVTITTDGITISGDPVVGGTLIGGFTVKSAVRVVFDNMTVKDGTNHGVRAEDGASVRVSNCTIENHPRDGVFIGRGSNALIEGSTVQNNGRYAVVVSSGSSARLRDNPLIQSNVFEAPRTLRDPFDAVTLGLFHNSFVRLLGGNLVVNDGGGTAVSAFHLADFRQQGPLDRIVVNEGARAIQIGNGSTGELRGEFEVTGEVRVLFNSTMHFSKRFGPVGVIDGPIRLFADSAVFFRLFTLKGEIEDLGSVTVNGTLRCNDNGSHVGLFSGQEPEDIFPSAADRVASQCNDFNGNPVLPPQCSDGIDNDFDTFIDFPADPQCADAADNDESS